jgi:superfamily II DNA/RNA helicase
MPRSLILEPTRELAAQVSENFETYGKHHKLSMALLIGGVSIDDQIAKLDRGVDVLIATPGRLLDLFERGRILLRGVEIMVIDEADRMLDMGFIPDVERIIQLVNPNRQTLLFSATMPPEIRRLGERFMTDPEQISVAPPASPAETVDQAISFVASEDKRAALRTLLRSQPVKNALIFCNRKRDVDIVAKSLSKHGFDAAALHGDMPQAVRMQTLERFKANDLKLLVCSDVAARGLDIAGLSHVFLFDVPMHSEDYVHRIGRTGRAGMPGRSFTFATGADGKYVAAIEKLIGREIARFPIEGIERDDADERPVRRERGRRERTPAPEKAERAAKPERAERAPKPERAERAAKPERAERAPKPERAHEAAKPLPPRDERRGRGRERDRDREKDEQVLAFGDNVPAFMLRPARRAT